MEISNVDGLVYFMRGERVMMDRDLAEIYGVETKVLNQAVRRHRDRFPNDFMFQLNADETQNWKSQIVTSNSTVLMSLRKRPLAFTEQGVAMRRTYSGVSCRCSEHVPAFWIGPKSRRPVERPIFV